MNPVVALLHLRQVNRPLETYIKDFCKVDDRVDFNDVATKDIFRLGLN